MAAPTPIAETYLACINADVTIGVDPNTLDMRVIGGGFTTSYGVDEMTNNQSGGAYEDVKTYKTATGNMTLAYKTDEMDTLEAGQIYPLLIDHPDGPYFSGNVRLNEFQVGMDVKGGVKVQCTFRNQGAFTTTRPGGGGGGGGG